jgi:hypothetical protein
LKIAMTRGAAAVAPRGAEDAYAAVAGGQQRPGRADPVAGALKAWNVVATVAGDGCSGVAAVVVAGDGCSVVAAIVVALAAEVATRNLCRVWLLAC